MSTITAAIMTKNEAHDIAACIESVLWMDEVIVLDCGSTDGTQEIVKKYAPKVQLIPTDWPGFGEQSNRCIEMSSSIWCFLLDADERISPELKDEVLQIINSNTDCVAFKIPRLNYFMGRAMIHCLSPKSDQPTRLVKKGQVKYEDFVHPKLVAHGNIGQLYKFLIHYPFQNLKDIMEKANSYSTMGAMKLLEKKVKPGIIKTLAHATWAFIRIYFIKLGFLDGWPGFIIALSNFEGTFYRYAKLMELAAAQTSHAP